MLPVEEAPLQALCDRLISFTRPVTQGLAISLTHRDEVFSASFRILLRQLKGLCAVFFMEKGPEHYDLARISQSSCNTLLALRVALGTQGDFISRAVDHLLGFEHLMFLAITIEDAPEGVTGRLRPLVFPNLRRFEYALRDGVGPHGWLVYLGLLDAPRLQLLSICADSYGVTLQESRSFSVLEHLFSRLEQLRRIEVSAPWRAVSALLELPTNAAELSLSQMWGFEAPPLVLPHSIEALEIAEGLVDSDLDGIENLVSMLRAVCAGIDERRPERFRKVRLLTWTWSRHLQSPGLSVTHPDQLPGYPQNRLRGTNDFLQLVWVVQDVSRRGVAVFDRDGKTLLEGEQLASPRRRER
jgi:hypothetical protein